MTIVYRDAIGYIARELDKNGIDFDTEKGISYFTDANGNDFQIPIKHIARIVPCGIE